MSSSNIQKELTKRVTPLTNTLNQINNSESQSILHRVFKERVEHTQKNQCDIRT